MVDVNIHFTELRDISITPLTVPLSFGVDTPPTSESEVTIFATLSGVTATAEFLSREQRNVEIFATLSSPIATAEFLSREARTFGILATCAPLTGSFELNYDVNVPRYVETGADLPYQAANKFPLFAALPFQQSDKLDPRTGVEWDKSKRLAGLSKLNFENATAIKVRHSFDHENTIGLYNTSRAFQSETATPMKDTRDAGWQSADGIFRSGWGFESEILLPMKPLSAIPWGQAIGMTKYEAIVHEEAVSLRRLVKIRWQQTKYPFWGRPLKPPKPPKPPYVATANLSFRCKCVDIDPLHVNLSFGLTNCITQKVHYIMNSTSLVRASDELNIDCFGASTSTDCDSWCWNFTASIPPSQLSLISPIGGDPVEVILTINDQEWAFLVESFSDSSQFNQNSASIAGRGLSSLLDAPYAIQRSFVQTEAMTSRQAAQAELDRTPAGADFELDWQLVDELGWVMPIGTWNYNNLTPMQAIITIANAAGGFVYSDPIEKVLHVLPKYAVPSWTWGLLTPDRVVSAGLMKTANLQWTSSPSYNGVYVSGQTTGVTALVKRTGTAGDVQPPMVVDPLISASPAARQRGITILSQGGKQAEHNVAMPISAETSGVVFPNTLMQTDNYTGGNWRGMARGVSIQASVSQKILTVTQNVTFERHYED